MYRRTVTWTWAKTLEDAMLAALTTVPGAALLTTPKCILFVAGGPITPLSTIAGLTVATFTGYTVQTVTLSAPVIIGPNQRAVIASVRFICSTDSPSEPPILGWALSDGATAFYGGEDFATPINITLAGQFLDIDIILPLPLIFTPVIS